MNHMREATKQHARFFLVAALGIMAWFAAETPAGAQRSMQPNQVLVESRFVEVDDRNLRKVGAPLFRTGEVELKVYGLGGTGNGERIVTDSRTVRRTETVSETSTVRETKFVESGDPPVLTPVDVDREVTTKREVTSKKTEKRKRNAAPIQGGFGGAGVAAKYFVTQNIGLGIEGDWLEGESSIGIVKGSVTVRFPMGSNAPYVFAGAGVQFGGQTLAVGTLGGGVEHRFTPHCGVFGDAAWMFGSHENAVVFRLGVTMAFGPGQERGSAADSGGARTVSWREINPIIKEVQP